MVIYGSQGRSLGVYGLLMLEEKTLREVRDIALIRLKHTTGDCSADNSQHGNYGLRRGTSACMRAVDPFNACYCRFRLLFHFGCWLHRLLGYYYPG